MERLAAFRPHLTGAVWRGTATRLNDIHIELYCDDSKAAELALIDQRVDYEVSRGESPRGREVDVLNMFVPSAEPARRVRVALTVLDYDDLRGALRSDGRGRPSAATWPRSRCSGAAHEPAPPHGRRPLGRGGRGGRGRGALAPARRGDGDRASSGTRLSRRPTARRCRWAACAASRCCSTSGRPGARPASHEMPLLDAFATAHPGWNVLALAVDAADPVRRSSSERRLRLAGRAAPDVGLELGHRLGNVAGGLPFSVAFAATGAVAQRKLGCRRRAPAEELGELRSMNT